jgi:hypothetical protein
MRASAPACPLQPPKNAAHAMKKARPQIGDGPSDFSADSGLCLPYHCAVSYRVFHSLR